MRKRIGAIVALCLISANGMAQAADKPCLAQPEAEALITAVIPDVLQGIAARCSTTLPPDAALRGGLQPLLTRYRAAADQALPKAKDAFAKLAGGDTQKLDPALVRPMLSALLSEKIGSDFKPTDCPSADRIITLLSPLPPENMSELFVTVVQMASHGKQDRLEICPAATAATGNAVSR